MTYKNNALANNSINISIEIYEFMKFITIIINSYYEIFIIYIYGFIKQI